MLRIATAQLSGKIFASSSFKPQLLFQRRNLFTKDFLGVSVFLQKQEVALKEFAEKNTDIISLRKDIQRAFNVANTQNRDESAIVKSDGDFEKVMLSDDVRKMLYTSANQQDVEEARLVVRKFVVDGPCDNMVITRKKGYLFKDFMALCNSTQAVKSAQALWRDEEFMAKVEFVDPLSGRLGMNMPAIADTYLDLLYKKKMYKVVLEEIDNLKKHITEIPTYILTAGMMSCLQLNTPESMAIATKIYSENSEKLIRFPKMVHPYAMLACLQGNYGLAFEALSFTNRRSLMRTSLLVHVLCKLNRTSEAHDLLEGILREAELEDRPQALARIVFPLETVMTLTKATEASNDKALKVRLASIFSRLDKVASISQLSLFDAVTADIDCSKSMKYRRDKNWQRIQRQKTMIADEEDGDANDDEDHRYIL